MTTNVKEIIRPEVLSQQSHCNSGAYSFPNETSPEEFVLRTVRAIALRIPTVHHCTPNMHVHIRERMISCFFFFLQEKKNRYRHVNGFGDISFISPVCHRAKSSIQKTTWVK